MVSLVGLPAQLCNSVAGHVRYLRHPHTFLVLLYATFAGLAGSAHEIDTSIDIRLERCHGTLESRDRVQQKAVLAQHGLVRLGPPGEGVCALVRRDAAVPAGSVSCTRSLEYRGSAGNHVTS